MSLWDNLLATLRPQRQPWDERLPSGRRVEDVLLAQNTSNDPWQRIVSALQGAALQNQMQPSSLPDRPQFEQEGQPLFASEATAPALVEPSPTTTPAMPHVEPVRSTLTGSPTLPDTPGNMEWVNRVGRAYTPQPVDQVYYGPDTTFGQEHPKLGRFADLLRRQAYFLDPTGPAGQEYAYQRQLEEQRRALPLEQFLTGQQLVGSMDDMRFAQQKSDTAAAEAQRQAEMHPLEMRYRQALTKRAEADAIRGPAGSDFDAYIARLETDKGALLTGPEMLAARTEWMKNGGSSQGTPFGVLEYEYYANQARARGETPMPIEQYKTLAADTYMQGRYIQTQDPVTGQVTAVFPNAPNKTFTAPAGQVTPTAAGRIAASQAAFESTNAELDTLEKMATKIFTATDTGGVAKQAGRSLIARTPIIGALQEPDLHLYITSRDAFGSMLTRAAGESGVLTQQDVSRILRALPDPTVDTQDTAAAKLRTLRSLYKSVVQGAMAAYSSGEVPTPEDFAAAGVRDGGVLRDPDTGRRWVLQNGTVRPIILGDN